MDKKKSRQEISGSRSSASERQFQFSICQSICDFPSSQMESVFVLYADGTIVEADLHSGAVLRQVQSFQGAFHLSASQIACWPNSAASVASTLSSSTALILQNKNSSKAHFWSCFDVRGDHKRLKRQPIQKKSSFALLCRPDPR